MDRLVGGSAGRLRLSIRGRKEGFAAGLPSEFAILKLHHGAASRYWEIRIGWIVVLNEASI